MEGLRRNFEAKYAAVGNNDPAVTEVDCTGRILFEFFGNGDAHLLGVSLQRNSHVKSIILALSTLEVEVGREGAVDSLSPLLNYLRQSQSMRKIELRGTTTIFSRPLSVTVLRRFLLAIAENSMIEELILFVINVRPEGFAELMRTTQSIYKLTITFCTFGMRISSLELVAHAIGTNRSIEILTIKNVDVDLASPVLLRLGAHPWIRMVEICGGYRFNRERDLDREPFIRALQSFIPSSRMLEHFTIGDYILTEDVMTAFATGIGSNTWVDQVAVAIAENQNLKSLTIDNSYRYDLVSPVLARLGSNPQLRMLQIRYGNHGETPNTLRNLLLRLRQNGSLYDVVVIDSAFWSSAKHYCRRNQQIPAMLANPQLHDDDNEMGKTDLDFFPKLFEVAKQARGTAPNSILIGLMALRDFVGPLENA